jgi:hypothetical protein
MTPSAAHVSTPCSARSAPVLDGSRSARRPGVCSRATDWSDEPEAVRLSLPAKRKEYRDHHNDPMGTEPGWVTDCIALCWHYYSTVEKSWVEKLKCPAKCTKMFFKSPPVPIPTSSGGTTMPRKHDALPEPLSSGAAAQK